MLTENKFSKYLLYAIGEIVLVVVGILIALQINNWNEQQKIYDNQEKYLMLLKTEALNNLKEIEKATNFANNLNIWQIKVFELIDANQDTITEYYLSKVFKNAFINTYSFKYENSVLSELKSSGDLKNILNDSLRKQLIALEPLVLSVKGQEKDVKQDFEDINDYIKSNGSFRTIVDDNGPNNLIGITKSTHNNGSNIHLLAKEEFENNLIFYTGTNKNLVINHYPRLENHLNKIIEIIERCTQL